jgi:hypothetical protein
LLNTVLDKVKPLIVIAGWAATIAGFTLGAIFQGLLLPKVVGNGGGLLPEVLGVSSVGLWVFYLGCFGTSVLAALVLADASKALVSFFPSYVFGALITYIVLIVPALTGTFPLPSVLEESAVIFTFTAFFPVLLFAALAGTLLGIFLAEKIL